MAQMFRVMSKILVPGLRPISEGTTLSEDACEELLGADWRGFLETGQLAPAPKSGGNLPQGMDHQLARIRDEIIRGEPEATPPNTAEQVAERAIGRMAGLTVRALEAEATVLELNTQMLDLEKKLEAESQRAEAFEAEITKLQAPPAGQKGDPATDAEKGKPKGGK